MRAAGSACRSLDGVRRYNRTADAACRGNATTASSLERGGTSNRAMLNVGTLVLDCDFRHPAVLSRELATIDVLSEGRLELGLGAGWKRLDYDRSGIPMDSPKVRVDRMIEHTAVLKGLFADGPFSFEG